MFAVFLVAVTMASVLAPASAFGDENVCPHKSVADCAQFLINKVDTVTKENSDLLTRLSKTEDILNKKIEDLKKHVVRVEAGVHHIDINNPDLRITFKQRFKSKPYIIVALSNINSGYIVKQGSSVLRVGVDAVPNEDGVTLVLSQHTDLVSLDVS
jgi:hypothetical protein